MASGLAVNRYLDELHSQLIDTPLAISSQNTSKAASNRRLSASDGQSDSSSAPTPAIPVITPNSGIMEPVYWLQCTFHELNCKMQFYPEDYETWYSHCLSHWNGHQPPRDCLCIFCDEKFEGTNSWCRRMSHIASHFAYGRRVEDSSSDFAVYRYMYKKDLLAEVDYITITKDSQHPNKGNYQREKAPASVPTSEFLLEVLKIITSSVCMLFGVVPIHNYQVLEGTEAEVKAGNMKDGYLENNALDIAQILRNPSPAIFIVACMGFGLAAISYYHLHINDRHQSRFLSSGAKVGLLASVILSLITKDPFELKTYMPLAILVSLTLSSTFHGLLRIRPLITRAR